MKRFVFVLAVAALMAMMLVVMAASAMARPLPAGAGCQGVFNAHENVPNNRHTETAHEFGIPVCG